MYDEIEIEDMTYDPDMQIYHYPCPCGDRFEIGLADLRDGDDVGVCPSCSLMIRVIYEMVSTGLYNYGCWAGTRNGEGKVECEVGGWGVGWGVGVGAMSRYPWPKTTWGAVTKFLSNGFELDLWN